MANASPTGPMFVGARIVADELDALIKGLQAKIGDLRPAYALIDRDVTERLRAQFATRGAALGTPWAPLSPNTIRARTRVMKATRKKGKRSVNKPGRARAGFATPLQDTRRLWASYVKGAGPESYRVIDRMRYARGSAVPYADAHQRPREITQAWGRPLKSAITIPARQVVPDTMPAPVLAAWEGTIERYIVSGALQFGAFSKGGGNF